MSGDTAADADTSDSVTTFKEVVERAVANLPAPVRFRAQNSFEGFRRARLLLDLDREIASFRAITVEEEAVAALFRALQLRGYEGAERLSLRRHQDKAAAPFFIHAVTHSIAARAKFRLDVTIKVDPPKVTVGVPVNQFGKLADAPPELHIELVNPLDIVSERPGVAAGDYFDESVEKVSGDRRVDKLISDAANSRNRILYAHDSGLPESQLTPDGLLNREKSAIRFLIFAIAVMQTDMRQALAQHCLTGFLKVLKRQPSAE